MQHAIDNQLEMHFDYPSSSPGGEVSRRVIPSGFTPEGHVRGYDLSNGMWKNWKLNKIIGPSGNGMQPRSIEPPEDIGDSGSNLIPGPSRPNPTDFNPKKVKINIDAPLKAAPPTDMEQFIKNNYADDYEHPNVNAFRDAKENGQQVTFEHEGETHTIIPRSINDFGRSVPHSTVQGYCTQHGKEEVITPFDIKSVGVIEPQSQELPTPSYITQRSLREQELKNNAEDFKKGIDLTVQPAAVEPTHEEYEEARASDIDPDTFDKATYKRVRNLGATHPQIIEAISANKIPIEDYEDAYKTALSNNDVFGIDATSNDTHVSALGLANKRQSAYNETVNSLRSMRAGGQESPVSSWTPLSDDDHNYLAEQLFGHHMALRNYKGKHETPHLEVPGGRRAHEWVMSECTKLDPSLKAGMGARDFYDSSMILPNDNGWSTGGSSNPTNNTYTDVARSLLNHYTATGMRANSIKDFIVNRRKKNAVLNIASSQFFPYEYTPEKYEED